MSVLDAIVTKSKEVDYFFSSANTSHIDSLSVCFSVPVNHSRFSAIKQYFLEQMEVESVSSSIDKEGFVLVDRAVANIPFVKNFLLKTGARICTVSSDEAITKTEENAKKLVPKSATAVVAIGGGLVLNVGAYIAEQVQSDLILVPTTVLSMADGSGGKVRLNLNAGTRVKHKYKSFYEPNMLLLDKRFLDFLSKVQITTGLVEIIKHGLFQSPALLSFLKQKSQEILENKELLRKAILWAVCLKHVCLELDPEETTAGSHGILRAGHDVSDKIEENLKFTMPHGNAVAIGIIQQLETEKKTQLLKQAQEIFGLFGIPRTIEEYKRETSSA